eukprot:6577442-Karenia_brevis.AAC.1
MSRSCMQPTNNASPTADAKTDTTNAGNTATLINPKQAPIEIHKNVTENQKKKQRCFWHKGDIIIASEGMSRTCYNSQQARSYAQKRLAEQNIACNVAYKNTDRANTAIFTGRCNVTESCAVQYHVHVKLTAPQTLEVRSFGQHAHQHGDRVGHGSIFNAYQALIAERYARTA